MKVGRPFFTLFGLVLMLFSSFAMADCGAPDYALTSKCPLQGQQCATSSCPAGKGWVLQNNGSWVLGSADPRTPMPWKCDGTACSALTPNAKCATVTRGRVDAATVVVPTIAVAGANCSKNLCSWELQGCMPGCALPWDGAALAANRNVTTQCNMGATCSKVCAPSCKKSP